LPGWGWQSLTALTGSTQLRSTQGTRNILNGASVNWNLTTKWEGNGDPISRAGSVFPATITSGQELRIARCYVEQVGNLALDSTLLGQVRSDLLNPATLSVATGTLTTNAAGDTDTDGFVERHGWYQMACDGSAEWTLPLGSASARVMPQFFLTGYALGSSPRVTLNGEVAVAGEDYWLDTTGSVALLQLADLYTEDLEIAVQAAGGSGAGYRSQIAALKRRGFFDRPMVRG
jgi:hypothetical protein